MNIIKVLVSKSVRSDDYKEVGPKIEASSFTKNFESSVEALKWIESAYGSVLVEEDSLKVAQFETENGSIPTAREVSDWSEGKLVLFHALYTFKFSVGPRELGHVELLRIFPHVNLTEEV